MVVVVVVAPPLDHLRLELLGGAEAEVADVDVVRQGERQLPKTYRMENSAKKNAS